MEKSEVIKGQPVANSACRTDFTGSIVNVMKIGETKYYPHKWERPIQLE
jgi:hypothetical protein